MAAWYVLKEAVHCESVKQKSIDHALKTPHAEFKFWGVGICDSGTVQSGVGSVVVSEIGSIFDEDGANPQKLHQDKNDALTVCAAISNSRGYAIVAAW